MNSRRRLTIGFALVVIGLAIALFPIVSVWRVSGQVLEELPSLDGSQSTDSRHRIGALLDPDFTLADRVHENTTAEGVRDALIADGYASFAIRGEIWYSKECCGDYDAVWVSIDEATDSPDAVRLSVTTADGDIQSAAGLFAFLGLVLFVPGVAIAASGINRANSRSTIVPDSHADALPG